MKAIKTILLFSFGLILIGCGTDTTQEPIDNNKYNNHIEFNQITANKKSITQDSANEAKEYLSVHDEINTIYAVNTSEKLLIAIEVPHHERLGLAQIQKDRTNDMADKFPNMEVEISTDKKIVLELERIEEALKADSMSKKELEKELDKVINLSKEQT